MNYDHLTAESTWKKFWEEREIYKTEDISNKPKYYVLDMFPYPSGVGLHVGHPRGYIASDVLARFKRMQGFNVLHPMGFDSFGLPAEQYAIKTGNHPGPYTDELVAHYKKQLENIGFSYDWSREVATHRPEYYKWTQWIFLQLFNSWFNPKTNKAEKIETCIEMLKQENPAWEQKTDLEKQEDLMKYRLAYEGYAEVNWCEEMGTVLANDEIVTSPDGTMVSERGDFPVVKKSMRQWFMRISTYADRLLSDLEPLDWPESIKSIQKNWIGKSEGAEIDFNVVSTSSTTENTITVFTTRADTLFGVTYVVLAPEHALVLQLLPLVQNKDEVEEYIKKANATSEDDRINDKKEKTGVELKGIFAKNPANGELVPVWIADYVLASYGTGAVMAVPAHDERDFEFAKKYNLPIKKVIARETGLKRENEEFRDGGAGVVFDPLSQKYAVALWQSGGISLFAGGPDEGENVKDAIIREVKEESGLYDFAYTEWIETSYAHYYHRAKLLNRVARAECMLIVLNSTDTLPVQHESHETFELAWKSAEEIKAKWLNDNDGGRYDHYLRFLNESVSRAIELAYDTTSDSTIFKATAMCEYGKLENSEEFDGKESSEAKKLITQKFGRAITKYKMRDAIFARQRYWGEPIPLVHKQDGTVEGLSEDELPLVLPQLDDFAPAGNGQSPLSKSAEWVEKGYETNTMPGWAGSSWYFLRYMDPKNPNAFASKQAIDYWQDVDMYVGGSEHATGHLLYSRFWHKALFDLGFVTKPEPFKALRNQGMIAGTDGRKMSKRWGNVINPDDVVNQLGADTLRVYESFMGPFEAHLPWSTDGIVGSRRFVERVYRFAKSKVSEQETPIEAKKQLHKTIKKVTTDINDFSFNTAISSLMICLNEFEKAEFVSKEDFTLYLQILAPFAPFIADELWHNLYPEKANKSIHTSTWPTYNEALTIDDEVTIGVQVNGKLRGDITIGIDEDEESIKQKALAHENVQKWLEGKEPKKVIVVKGKIVSVVV